MGSDVAPELVFDQGLGLYYPTATDYYGYYYTEPEPPIEWDNHHQVFGLDGQDLCVTTMQTEGLSDVCYMPSYGYVQPPYNPYNPSILDNPYNPSIPGALIGSEASFTAAHYETNPAQQFLVSSPVYMPVGNEASSVAVPISYQTPLWTSTVALPTIKPVGEGKKLALPLAPMNIDAASQVVALKHVASKPLQSYSGLSHAVPKLEHHKNMPNTWPAFGALTSGSIPTIKQGTNHMSNLKVASAFHPAKADELTSTGYTSYGATLNLCSEGDNKHRPRFQMSRALANMSGSLVQQSRGPRSGNANCQWASPLAVKAYSSKSGSIDSHGNITISADDYNRDDLRIEYEAAKFFVIKSYSEDDVHKSIKYNVWSSTPSGNKRLDNAFNEAQKSSSGRETCPVFLFFSVNVSGHFCGVAEMIGPVDFRKDMDFWQQDRWLGHFPVKWKIIKDVANTRLRHILLENNEYRPVSCSRDTQEVPFLQGNEMLQIFKNSPASMSLLDDFMHYEERERVIHEGKSRVPGRCSVVDEEEKVCPAEQHTAEAEEHGRSCDAGNPHKVMEKAVADEVGCSGSNDQAVEGSRKPADLIILGHAVGSPDVETVGLKNDVITVGSVHIKVGRQACSGVLFVGSIPI